MSETIKKFAPTAVIFAMVVWCCWPFVGGSAHQAGLSAQSDLPRIARSMLSPSIKPATERDPFQPPMLGPKESDETAAIEPDPITEPVKAPHMPDPEIDMAKILDKLALNGTYIQGNRRFALISGQVCEQGVPTTFSEDMPEPCVVTEICPDKVVIEHRGRTVKLTHQNVALTATPAVPRQSPTGTLPQ